MSRFCFVSRAQPGHCDFGGMGYIRTALELKNRGHEVDWILSCNQTGDNIHLIARSKKTVNDYGIQSQEFYGLHITASQKSEELGVSARNFARHLESHRYDCIVIDRLCVLAGFSANLVHLPWATVGTDGREWTKKRLRTGINQGLFPGPWESSPIIPIARSLCNNKFPSPSDKSFWATSPFLNISFFPKAIYQEEKDVEHPRHSHFVGCGPAPEPYAEERYLLVTFGNSFDPVLRQKLTKILKALLRDFSVKMLFLSGNPDATNDIRRTFRKDSFVEVREWMPYDTAYRGAIGVVGHGGTSYIWYGLCDAKPLLAVPFIADQLYGSLQLRRLNVGRALLPFVVPWHVSHPLQEFGRHVPRKLSVFLRKRELVEKLSEILNDQAVKDSCMRLSRIMRRGGGVQASASLIESLARFREPISTCLDSPCCC